MADLLPKLGLAGLPPLLVGEAVRGRQRKGGRGEATPGKLLKPTVPEEQMHGPTVATAGPAATDTAAVRIDGAVAIATVGLALAATMAGDCALLNHGFA